MKKFFFSLLFLLSTGVVMAQNANPGSWKAYDKIQKGDKAFQQRSEEGFAQSQTLYKEAETIIAEEINAAKAKSDVEKLALLYTQDADLQIKILNPEMTRASQGIPFDTIQFCTLIDRIITEYNTAAQYNITPNAKGKVKTNPIVTAKTHFGVLGNLSLYYNCGAFMDAMGKKQESLDYFQKYVDLPKISPVFSDAERDSIYSDPKNAKIYSTARFNLALQNFYLKNWDKAVTCADEALKDTANIHDLYLIKINALGEKKDSVAWRNTIVEAAQRTGSSTFVQNLLYHYMQNNKVDEAVALADKMVVDYPNSKTAWYMKGSIELNINKDYAGARESFQKALDIDPDYEEALYNMGTAYINEVYDLRNSGKFKYIGTNKAITGKTSDGSYQRNKAIYDKELATVRGYYEKAKPYLEHLRELTPDNAKRWASPLQMVYSSLGDKEKAQEMDALLETANAQ